MVQEITEAYRLSPQQKHLWSLQQANHSSAYIVSCAVLIEGPLLPAMLFAAMDKVVARNEILRTTFQEPAERAAPVQVISDMKVVWRQEQDLSLLEKAVQEERVNELLRASARTHRNPGHDATLQASVLTLAPESHVLLLTLPSLCADVAGCKNLVRELAGSYEAGLSGQELDELSIQYADLAQWLGNLQETAEAEPGREYWRGKDMSALPALALPFENTEVEGDGFDIRQCSAKIDRELTTRMSALADQYQVSLAELALTCWQVLLWRLIGQTQIIIGVGCEGRSYEGLEEAIGLFAKYLPLQVDLGVADKFSDVISRTSRSLREINEWEEYFSWEYLGKASGARIGPRFFPFSFDFEESSEGFSAGDLKFSLYRAEACIERFKVKLTCIHQDGELLTNFQFDSRRFSLETIDRLAAQFHRLVQSAIDDPEAPIATLDLLGDNEKRRLLSEFNRAEEAQFQAVPVCELFEQWATRAPDRLAVKCGDDQLTYAELNVRANKLAHYLRRLGVGPDNLVALCLERSTAMAVAILGILKAGAAYVPLDFAYPKDRLAFMLNQTQAPLLLTQAHLRSGLPEHTARVICLDADWSTIAQESEANPGDYSRVNRAYVIYTSGTTGEPRGVMITHANLNHYTQAIGNALGLRPDDCYLQTASISFSSSVRQLIVPLAAGASVVIASSEERMSPLALFELIKKSQVTIIDLVPSHWRACIQALSQMEPDERAELLDNELRLVLSASEVLKSDLPHIWRTQFKHKARLVNMFGQTETTGIVAVYPIDGPFTDKVKSVPLGKPISRTQIYLLDPRQRLAPLGAEGELYIGGDGLGQGYLNRPDLTAERFVPDAFATEPGRRLYRTGDAACYLPDGAIEFHSRIDYQVKIRGFRVEVGEIEAVLSSHAAVKEAVVVAHDDSAGGKRLVAYLVPDPLLPPSRDGLQSFLSEKLPEYMIPASFVMLAALPLTVNGKLDRSALPAPERANAVSEFGFVAPRTPVEETLTEIWKGVLGIDRVGIHDHFFRLGGYSLLATVLVSRIRDAFKIDLQVANVFSTPTVSGLAQIIEQSLIGQTDEEVLAGLLQEMNQLSDEEVLSRLAATSLSAKNQ